MEKHCIDEIKGKMFGNLEVLSEAEPRGGQRYVTCKCHRCGRIKDFYLYSLTRGITTACGCGHRSGLLGKKFGQLEVIDYVKKKGKRTFWLCKCDCGNVKEIDGCSLVRGRIKTCGHKRPTEENHHYKHGLTHSRIMNIWFGMKGRCYNTNDKAYKNYGARGITICDEWLNDVKAFYDWSMNNGYNDNLTIDRIDINGNYEPSNCRWVTRKVQCNNQRNNHKILYEGELLTIAQISERNGIPSRVIRNRIYQGWDDITAVTFPYKKRK